MRIDAHHAHRTADCPERRRGELRAVLEMVCADVRRLGGAFRRQGRIGVAADRRAEELTFARAVGGADGRAPESLAFGAEHEFNERLGEFLFGRTAQDADGVAAHGRAAGGRGPDQAHIVGSVDLMGEGCPVIIDAHAGDRVAVGDIERNLGRAVGEIASVGGHALHEAEAVRPAQREPFPFQQRSPFGRLQAALDLGLDDEFEGARHRAALGRVR